MKVLEGPFPTMTGYDLVVLTVAKKHGCCGVGGATSFFPIALEEKVPTQGHDASEWLLVPVGYVEGHR